MAETRCERCGRSLEEADVLVVHGSHEDIDLVCEGCVTDAEASEHRVTRGASLSSLSEEAEAWLREEGQ